MSKYTTIGKEREIRRKKAENNKEQKGQETQ